MLLPALILGVLISSFTLAFALEWGMLTLIIRMMGRLMEQPRTMGQPANPKAAIHQMH